MTDVSTMAGAPAEAPRAAAAMPAAPRPLEALSNVEMSVSVELGRARLLVRELLELRAGSIIELDRAVGSPVDILVNGTVFARGEVVVIDDELGVRITDVVEPEEAQ
jgi:flagellar motor switch protein FliN/FliY